MSAQGQDRSNWQRVGPWTGLTFGVCKATEATSYTDPTFASNWANLRSEGVLRGAYHFFHPAVSAVAQAQYFVGKVRDEGLQDGDILVSDTEITVGTDGKLRMSPHAAHRSALYDSGSDGVLVPLAAGYEDDMPVTMDAAAFPGTVRSFLDEVHALVPHSPVLIYTNLSVGSQLSNCTGYGLWIAWPEDTPPPSVHPWNRWVMWQWAWTGGFDNCDRDAYNGTAEEMKAWVAGYTPKPPGDTVEVPDVVGQRTEHALEILKAAGLDGHIGGGFDPGKENWVVSQTPGKGARVAKGSRVDVGSAQHPPA